MQMRKINIPTHFKIPTHFENDTTLHRLGLWGKTPKKY